MVGHPLLDFYRTCRGGIGDIGKGRFQTLLKTEKFAQNHIFEKVSWGLKIFLGVAIWRILPIRITSTRASKSSVSRWMWRAVRTAVSSWNRGWSFLKSQLQQQRHSKIVRSHNFKKLSLKMIRNTFLACGRSDLSPRLVLIITTEGLNLLFSLPPIPPF